MEVAAQTRPALYSTRDWNRDAAHICLEQITIAIVAVQVSRRSDAHIADSFEARHASRINRGESNSGRKIDPGHSLNVGNGLIECQD